jgi:hypothetical protein
MAIAPAVAHPRSVPGDFLGLQFPPTLEMLHEQGPEFLTRAFHAFGSLDLDNRVIAVTEEAEFIGGGMGRKLLLGVEYEKPSPKLQTLLFVKLQLDFGNPLRDVFGPLMRAEIRFAILSRRDQFPITVPKCYFADYNAATTSGLLITERIGYGEAGIEPRYEKCFDYRLSKPLEHYQALTRSLAKLAGFHKAGGFGPGLTEHFPFDPTAIDAGNKIPYTREQLQQKSERIREFCRLYPQLIPANLREPSFLDGVCNDLPLVIQYESEIRSYINSSVDYVALCHWNMNLDNAWFWRDREGVMQVGLLDWGSVGQMSIAQAFYGMTCCAEVDFLNEHRRSLLQMLIAEYAANGGPVLDLDELMFIHKLGVVLLGVAFVLDAPALVEGQIPDLSVVEDRYDSKIADNFLGRVELQILAVFLNEWQVGDIGATLRTFAN